MTAVLIVTGTAVRERGIGEAETERETERIVNCGEAAYQSRGERKEEDEFHSLCICSV